MIVPLRQRGAGANRLQCKWGRHCCRPHSHRRVDDPLLVMRPANLPLYVQGSHAWLPMSSLLLPRLATGVPEICHRRSRRHPAFARAGLASAFGPKPVGFSLPRLCLAETRSFTDPVCRGWGLAPVPLLSFAARFLTCPVSSRRSHLLVSRLAIGRGLLHAISSWARGQMSPPSLRSKPLQLPSLAAFCSSCFVSRRQVEGAPETAI